MPKSRNRKGQKKKSAQRSKMIKAKDQKRRKEFIELMNKAQLEAMQEQSDKVVELDDVVELDGVQETDIVESKEIDVDVEINL